MYLLMLYENEELANCRTRDDIKGLLHEYLALEEDMKERKSYVIGKPLMPTDTATTVRVREGKVFTADGPFTEAKEQMGGIYLLECDGMEEALEYAARIPMARTGCIEVRPIMKIEGA